MLLAASAKLVQLPSDARVAILRKPVPQQGPFHPASRRKSRRIRGTAALQAFTLRSMPEQLRTQSPGD
jgi:hypothetical protein